MPKITFMGAGSTVFARNVLGDSLLAPALRDGQFALYDIDATRLRDSKLMLENINRNVNKGRAKIATFLGVAQRRAALKDADFVVNAIQVGGYEPSTVIDFKVPAKYGLRQTIADTLGIGGIFRALRTIPVVLDFAADMEAVCPDAWFLNYVNPMAMITSGLLRGSSIRAVGLCHSVDGCAPGLVWILDLPEPASLQWKVAGINHQSWLLEITDGGKDLYPLIKKTAAARLAQIAKRGGGKAVEEAARARLGDKWRQDTLARAARDMVRLRIMLEFGHYVTESSEHNAEYMPYWIKSTHPELIDAYNIPLDEYPRRCIGQIAGWKRQREELVNNKTISHVRSHEYASHIMEAIITGVPARIGGNVMNAGLITNLPAKACVELACLVDRNGVQPTFVGDLPEQCAAMNRTNVNVQILTVEAALTRKKDHIYHAAMMDPHTAAELTIDQIKAMCDELIEAHGKYLPKYK